MDVEFSEDSCDQTRVSYPYKASQKVYEPAPPVETYSKKLDSSVKYVQYFPKGFRNLTLEQALNQIFHDKQFRSKRNSKTQATRASQEVDWNQHAQNFPFSKCKSAHRHSRGCSKQKRRDIAELQTQAFRYLMLQKPDNKVPNKEDVNKV